MSFDATKKIINVQRAVLKNCLDGLAGLPIEWKRNANEITIFLLVVSKRLWNR